MVVAPIAHNLFPQALVEARGLGRAHGLDVGVRFEELPVRGLQVDVVLGEAVVQPAEFVTVHQLSLSSSPRRRRTRGIVVEVVVQHVGRQIERQRASGTTRCIRSTGKSEAKMILRLAPRSA